MLKQIWIVECDFCGKTEKARAVSDRYNYVDYDIPQGWEHIKNTDFCLCPECAKLRSVKIK